MKGLIEKQNNIIGEQKEEIKMLKKGFTSLDQAKKLALQERELSAEKNVSVSHVGQPR